MSKTVNTAALFQEIDTYVNSEKEIRNMLSVNTGGPIIRPLGEHIAAAAFQLELNKNSSEAGFDGILKEENGEDVKITKYEIKSRMSTTSTPQPQFEFNMKNLLEKNFDYFVGIIFDQEYRVTEAFLAPWNFVSINKGNLQSQERFSITPAKFRKSVGKNGCIDVTNKIRQSWPR